MMKVIMKIGPSEQLYYIEENETKNDQLCQITYVSDKGLKKKEIFRSEVASILAFHIQYNYKVYPEFNVYPHHIYLLNSEKNLKRFSITGSQDD